MNIYKGNLSSTSKNIFYVYAWLRDKSSKFGPVGSPYYIGKGCKYRAYDKTRKSIPKNQNNIWMLATNMNEKEAFQAEMFFIYLYGRKDKNNGILINLSDGGEGVSGPKSEEHKAKIALSLKGQNISFDRRQKISNGVTARNNKVKVQLGYLPHTGRKKTDVNFSPMTYNVKLPKRLQSLTEFDIQEIRYMFYFQFVDKRKIENKFNITRIDLKRILNLTYFEKVPSNFIGPKRPPLFKPDAISIETQYMVLNDCKNQIPFKYIANTYNVGLNFVYKVSKFL